MRDPDLREKLRHHIASTLVGLALAALGTIASISISYLFTVFDRLDSDVRKEEYAFKEWSGKASRGSDFLRLVLEADQRSLDRMNRLQVVDLRKESSSRNRRALHQSLLDGAMNDLAIVTGYSPETTGFPVKLHESAQAAFKSEVEYWRSVGRIIDSLEQGKRLSTAALVDLRARLQDSTFTHHIYKSTLDDAMFGQELQRQVLQQQSQELKVEIKNIRWWARAALVGIFAAFLGFYLLIRVVVFKSTAEEPSKSSEIPTSGE